jgi:hypothetical protein
MLRRLTTTVVALAAAFPSAHAATTTPSAVVTAVAFRYLPGDVTLQDVPLQVRQGTTILFAPLDPLGNHSILSRIYVDDRPLFESDLIGPGQVAEVRGLEKLAPGVYEFTCSVHEYMAGSLEVVTG